MIYLDFMKNKALTVSIVIPVYNEEDHLKACLEAIAIQSVMPDEVLVVDNNSSDGTLALAKQFKFVKILHEKQQGVVFPRNKGFDAAKSDIIARIDADTQLPPNWVEQVVSLFNDQDIAAVSGPVGWYDAPARQLGLLIDKNTRKITWDLGSRDDAVFLFGSNMAITRQAWRAVRDQVCIRKDVHEDIDLAIHIYQAGLPVAFDDSLSAMTSSRRINDTTEQIKKYVKVYKNTYTVHDIQTNGIMLPIILLLSTHYGVKLLKRGYDPETRQFSLRKFIDNIDESRVQPM